MGELRDLTSTLRSFSESLTSIEDCMVVVLRNSEQESDWRHEQRNAEQQNLYRAELQAKALKQVQEACGAISHKLVELVERLDAQAQTRLEDTKELKRRVRALEGDEVTQT